MTCFRFPPVSAITSAAILLVAVLVSRNADADMVSFLVDPTTLTDTNMDGFVNGNDFQPVGDDGTIFALTPTNNFVGINRFLLSDTSGLHYGGGGGSTLTFDFSVDKDISLESYTLASAGFFLGDPIFNIMEGVTTLSANNTSNASGNTHSFSGGPLSLTAGTTYTFDAHVNGAAIQAFLGSWTYTPTGVPEPGSLALFGLAGMGLAVKRRR